MNAYSYSVDLEVCRICLASDSRLFDLHKYGLFQIFYEFAGTPISASDGLPQHICSYCCSLLKKSSDFKKKCRNTHTFLLNNLLQYHCLTTSFICSLDTSNFRLPYSTSKVEIESYPQQTEGVTNSHVKQELQIDYEDTDPIRELYDDNSKTDFDDYAFENQEIKTENGFVLVLDRQKERVKKRKKKVKDKITVKERLNEDISEENVEDKIKQFTSKYMNNIVHTDKKVFYEYILERYVKDVKKDTKRCTESIFETEDLCNVKLEDNTIFIEIENSNLDLTKKLADIQSTELKRKQFYQYIIDKYSKNTSNASNKKITDFTRMRVKKTKKKHRSKTQDEIAHFAKTYNVEVLVLNREEQIADIVSRKETEKYKRAKFKCEKCCRGFTVEKAFQNHLAIHDPSAGPHECEVCHLRFAKKGRLTKHLQMRHKFKFLCKLCSQITRNSTCAREHFKCHAGFKYICEHCGKIFSKYGSRINHIRIFHGNVTCDICQERFAGEAGLIAHKTKAHRELFKCLTCGVQFHNPDALGKHTELLQGEPCGAHIRPCTQCGENFANEEAMREHNLEFHNKQKPRIKTQSKSTVKLPSDQKPNVRWLARRTPRPPEDTQFPLEDDKKFKRKKANFEPQKFMCEMCAADGFASEAVLRYHQRIHTGEKPHPCPQCPKRFRIRELLQKHIRTHTGDRPYKCAHCPKAFKTASAHYTHQVVHTKIRRHRCHLCEKMFLTSTCVKTHIKTVHMKIPAAPRVRRRPDTDAYATHMAGY